VPEATLFVDDSAANVAGARAAGLVGYEYTEAKELAVEFGRAGLLKG
jgi:FMN phosphatase YigB (HAD superfamily)